MNNNDVPDSDPLAVSVNTLLSYIKDTIYDSAHAQLDYALLPGPLAELGKGLEYLFQLITETKNLAHELAKGKLDVALPPPSNEIAAPLKELHASLKHLTWQTQQISKGDYSQQVVFMGDFSAAFNNMIQQLDRHFHELEEARREAEKAREAADQASRSKTDFLAKMSHEIRTPMNAILGMSELALRETEPSVKNEHINMAKQAASNLLSIINDILDFSKIEAGKMEIINAEYSITNLINDMINIIRMRVADSTIRFVVNADSNIPQTLIGDETRIRQAVLNLLNNAVKYTEKGFVSLGVFLEYIDEGMLNLIFEVKDSGIGIKQEDMEKLFSDFTQFDIEKNRGIEGVGLGLAITNSIVKAMDGYINVESEYGEGSSFTVTLPQKYNLRLPMAKVENPLAHNALIFEKRDIYAQSIIYTVENLGINYTAVSNGAELYKEMEKQKHDYLFIAFTLFVKNEETILKFGKDIKTIILSSFGEPIPQRFRNVLSMPVYINQVADIFNNANNNSPYFKDSESVITFRAPSASVLIVDDINTNLKVAEGLLSPYKMQVDLCSSGIAAIEAVKNKRYDIVFMDHKMPGMDGIEATKRIRQWEREQGTRNMEQGTSIEIQSQQSDPDNNNQNLRTTNLLPVTCYLLPIIALTANAISGMREMFLENGFNDFLSKPIDTAKLNNILEKWIPKEKQVSI